MTLFANLIIAHLIADWIFQNHWIAINKTNIKHPALYVHGGIHFVIMVLLTGFTMPVVFLALTIAGIHMIIDTRKPIQWWTKTYRQTTEGEYAIHVQIWLDQVFHIVTIYIVILVFNL